MLYDTIREEPDIEVVGDVSEENAIVPATERTNPDCLIVPLDEPGAAMPICTEILAKRPHVRIVAIGEGTDVVEIYWMSEGRRHSAHLHDSVPRSHSAGTTFLDMLKSVTTLQELFRLGRILRRTAMREIRAISGRGLLALICSLLADLSSPFSVPGASGVAAARTLAKQ